MLAKFLICTIVLINLAHGRDPDPYVEALEQKKHLILKDGTEVIISVFINKHDTTKYRVFSRRGGIVVWDRSFTNELDEVWQGANFIPVIENSFEEDLNGDGYPEIGIAVWGGGNASWASRALLFSVKDGKLEFLKKQNINIEFSRSIYKSKADFQNPNYKCVLCKPN